MRGNPFVLKNLGKVPLLTDMTMITELVRNKEMKIVTVIEIETEKEIDREREREKLTT